MRSRKRLRIFLCHSFSDRSIAHELYKKLSDDGFEPWLDSEKILPGQDWEIEIEKAIENAHAVIVCLSHGSISKEGYIQREIKFVIDIALEKPEGTIFIIPLRLDDIQLPRRLRSLQYLDYFPEESLDWAYERLRNSLVTLSVDIPEIANREDIMSWDEYMNRIEETCSYLETALREFRYLPDAVIGITSGGLVAADLIGKRVYAGRNCPVLSLWAMRHVVKAESAFWYFDNEYNDATMAGIHNAVAKRKPREATLLLIDDHMGTGSTAIQATEYIKNRLGTYTHITYIPIVSRRLDNLGVVEEYLPHNACDKDGNSIFNITKEEFIQRLTTKALYFPYLKKQVNVSAEG